MELVISVLFLAMVVAGAAVIVSIMRSGPVAEDRPTERSTEAARAEAVAQANHTTLGPH